MRHIIAESEQIVALDTNVARELCYTQPSWVATFQQMREDSYHFCWSDVLLAEFLNQLESGRITPAQYQHSVTQLDTFVSRTFPVLPGKRQLYHMAGIQDPGIPPAEDPGLTQAYSIAIWSWLRNLSAPADLSTSVATFTYAGSAYQCPFQAKTVEAELQAERDRWSDFIHKFDSMAKDRLHQHRAEMRTNLASAVDEWATCSPPLSVRFDLWIKFLLETIIQRSQSTSPYNPDSDRRRNDGIDVLLKQTFLLPAFVCTLDTRYIARFDPIDSFQKSWLKTPEMLSQEWSSGSRPVTAWP